jgi:hypothetical protein
MTKLETIQHLLAGNDPEVMAQVAESMMNTWSDEKVLKAWNHVDSMDDKGIKLVKVDNGEFEIVFYAPLRDFFNDAWRAHIELN